MTRISLPGHRRPGLENILSENQSILGTIRAVLGPTVKRADRRLRALPTKGQAEQMGVAGKHDFLAEKTNKFSFLRILKHRGFGKRACRAKRGCCQRRNPSRRNLVLFSGS
ncbi:hypothetical protein [Mesorhizobium sp.]|uniref:hypothetical protein n=1 Tax=Mesorhizobium sp. TaxID=1871066 RepID=UPI0025E0C084|nr:hypothetical protein [Mesorhizobium sp.]